MMCYKTVKNKVKRCKKAVKTAKKCKALLKQITIKLVYDGRVRKIMNGYKMENRYVLR